ncbi:MAG: hypothetical protein AVDCRST_MAG47-1488, partial [uncultured Nocardioidaceae bacterium]
DRDAWLVGHDRHVRCVPPPVPRLAGLPVADLLDAERRRWTPRGSGERCVRRMAERGVEHRLGSRRTARRRPNARRGLPDGASRRARVGSPRRCHGTCKAGLPGL